MSHPALKDRKALQDEKKNPLNYSFKLLSHLHINLQKLSDKAAYKFNIIKYPLPSYMIWLTVPIFRGVQ